MSSSEIIYNSMHEGRSEETLNRAFRLNKTALNALHEEAKRRNVTVNAIVNELIMKHTLVDRILKKNHSVVIGSSILKIFTEALSEDRIVEMAEEVANDVLHSDFPAEETGDESAAGILEALKILSFATSEYEYSEEEYGGKKIVILAHDVGKNWSLFTATYWKNLLNRKGIDVKISATDRAALLQFRQSDIDAHSQSKL